MSVTVEVPDGANVNQIIPAREGGGGGGGTVINYTIYTAPWVAEDPLVNIYFGPNPYETGANAAFFVAEKPTAYYFHGGYETGANAVFFVADPPITETPF